MNGEREKSFRLPLTYNWVNLLSCSSASAPRGATLNEARCLGSCDGRLETTRRLAEGDDRDNPQLVQGRPSLTRKCRDAPGLQNSYFLFTISLRRA